ncbi:hypothetical protein FACS189413_05280 [Bacteroidia bacterium]|nr:hypothetical protein FACS189413_05280 [Bacteroidia bacterium]
MIVKRLIFCIYLIVIAGGVFAYNDGFVAYQSGHLNDSDKQAVREYIRKQTEIYDPAEKMITQAFSGYHYHRDATEGVFHETRMSLHYALALLDAEEKEQETEAFAIIRKIISLQNIDPQSPSCGVWPYFMEEPLQTKKSSTDYNWADFLGVTLLDIYMDHHERLPADLREEIKNALILAARAIQKRDVHPGYTNIAIMGSYVTYLVAYLFDLPGLKEYAVRRWQNFYGYTQFQGGFSEYNSPTYTIIALDELLRMKRHIVAPEMQPSIDSLYHFAWNMVARHFHAPAKQWAGPQSRCYHTQVQTSFYGLLYQASDGKIDFGFRPEGYNVRLKHCLPEECLSYFLSPVYPRIEQEFFNQHEPKVFGTCWLTEKYTLGSVNRSNLWIQRRPLLSYWNKAYLRLRFLHDGYDFCAASFYSSQKENKILAALTFTTNGGDKHVRNDDIQNGKFPAHDLRLRFEFGNTPVEDLIVPDENMQSFGFQTDEISFCFRLFYYQFGKFKGHWEKGTDRTHSWIDFVLYSGETVEINLSEMDAAGLGFVFAMDENASTDTVSFSGKNGILSAEWQDLQLATPLKPREKEENL